MSEQMPEGWVKKRLGDIAQIVSGGTPSRDVPAFWGGVIPWVTPTDITRTTGRILDRTADTITTAGLAASSAVLLPVGTILMTSRATVGECRIAGMAVSTNQGFKCLVPGSGLDGPFLYYQLLQNREHLKRFGVGSTFLEVSKKDTENFRVWLPESLREQRRIVEYLSSLDDAIERSQELILKYQQVRTGLMHDLFTRGLDANGQLRPPQNEAPELYKDSPLGCVPCDWNLCHLGTLADSLIDGPFGSNLKTEHYVLDGGVRVIRLQNVQSGYYDDADKVFVSARHARFLAKNRVVPGDVLIAALGDENYPVGRACLYPESLPPALNKADCFRLRSNTGKALNSFIMHCLNTPASRSQVERYKQGVTRQRINTTNLKKILVALPHLDEQAKILARIESSDQSIFQLAASCEKLQLIKLGLMNDLLNGCVVVKVEAPKRELSNV